MDLPADLREALDAALHATPVAELAPAVDGLIARYRDPADDPGDEAILARPVDVLAYAAYRMPATYAAVRAALTQVALAAPQLRPRRLIDLGGGTGAATWAATDVFPSLAELTILDRVPEALRLGQRLAGARPALRTARWEAWRMSSEAAVPAADLATISYLLGELAEPARAELIGAAVDSGVRAIVVVEPGTPAGYRRVLAARDAVLAAGLRVVAPCPHGQPCPLGATPSDWCHFAVRVNRSALHRRAKGATLGYEDEKFSYLAAVRDPGPPPSDSRPARVLRAPAYGKGLVRLRLCTPAGAAAEEIVSKRQGDRYRAARDLAWGDAWVAPSDEDPTPEDPTSRSEFRENSEN